MMHLTAIQSLDQNLGAFFIFFFQKFEPLNLSLDNIFVATILESQIFKTSISVSQKSWKYEMPLRKIILALLTWSSLKTLSSNVH